MNDRLRFGLLTLASLTGAASRIGGEGTTRAGTYFRIVCDFENEPVARQALETAEAAWPIAAKLCGSPDARPAHPLDIHLLRTVAAYEKEEAALTGGKFRKNLAFSSWEKKAAYVVLQPQCSDDALKTVGVPALTRRLLAHEVFHLVRSETIPNFESHPDWFADGAASWIEDEVLAALRLTSGLEKDPESSTDIRRARDLLEKGKLPSAREIFRDQTSSLEFYGRYAVVGLFFRFLKGGKHRPELEAILAEMRRLVGGEKFTERIFEFIERTLGSEGLDTLDREFKDFLRTKSPQWDQEYRSLEPVGKDWIQIAFPDTNAVAWRTEPVGKSKYALTGELEILPGASRQLNLLLGRTDQGFVSVAFVCRIASPVSRPWEGRRSM